MNLKSLLALYLCLLSTLVIAQTKIIAHKSHSGSRENFKAAMENTLFDMESSNYGQAPRRTVRTAKLDSVIYVSDSVSILVTSVYCHTEDSDDTIEWKAGRETLIKHPLFSKQHSLDSIKKVLATQYYFKNPISTVKFIGYDNKKKSAGKKKKGIAPLPALDSNDPQPPFTPSWISMIGMLLVFSLLIGAIAHKKYSLNRV